MISAGTYATILAFGPIQGDRLVESQASGRSFRKAEAVKAPLRCERGDAEALRQLGSVGKRSPRLTHRRLRHEQLGSEDIRFALELRGRRPGRDPFRGST